MKVYYINKKTDTNPHNDNEVHVEGCIRMPSALNREWLGSYSCAQEAVNAAKRKGYSRADGCYWCCPAAHKQ